MYLFQWDEKNMKYFFPVFLVANEKKKQRLKQFKNEYKSHDCRNEEYDQCLFVISEEKEM